VGIRIICLYILNWQNEPLEKTRPERTKFMAKS
jgi:hypothetical protein